MLYHTILFLHILGVIAWLGGAFTLTVLHLRQARTSTAAAGDALSGAGELLGRKVFGPAAGLTLITGIVMIGMMNWIMPAWVIWGFCGLIAAGFVGSALAGGTARALAKLPAAGATETPATRRLRRRLMLFSVIDLLILVSVVWAMVFKPTF